MNKLLTIGMPTYKDFDGVYFTIQALKMYHDLTDVELLLIDTQEAKNADIEKVCNTSGTKYVHKPEAANTPSEGKNGVFDYASGEYVLCIDCHILLEKDVVKKLKDYLISEKPEKDLLQGPLVYDDLKNISTHFDPQWRGHMYGTWATNPKVFEGKPFDIPMQGMGLFCMNRKNWVGFNRKFYGFGGEEGYIQEKVRQRGGRSLCLPFLRWVHRFGRPNGVPYKLSIIDRVVNYLIGWDELNLDLKSIEDYFKTQITAKEWETAYNKYLEYKGK